MAGEESPWDTLREARERWQAQAVAPHDAYVLRFRALARELDMAIAVTYLERWPCAPRHTVALIDRQGEAALTPGDEFVVAELDTGAGPVQIGAMICFDREFPESARILMLKGAELIVILNVCTMDQHRLAQVRTRAYENMVGVALANYAAPRDNGHSVAFHPIAHDQDGSCDTLVVEAGEAEGVSLAPFDLDAIRAWRSRKVWGECLPASPALCCSHRAPSGAAICPRQQEGRVIPT
jgi:predicted amidohydrolase